jgi:hypothetical protein
MLNGHAESAAGHLFRFKFDGEQFKRIAKVSKRKRKGGDRKKGREVIGKAVPERMQLSN